MYKKTLHDYTLGAVSWLKQCNSSMNGYIYKQASPSEFPAASLSKVFFRTLKPHGLSECDTGIQHLLFI